MAPTAIRGHDAWPSDASAQGPVEQHARRLVDLVQWSAQRECHISRGVEGRQLALASLPGLAIGLHDSAHRARLKSPGQRLLLAGGLFLGSLA